MAKEGHEARRRLEKKRPPAEKKREGERIGGSAFPPGGLFIPDDED